MVNKLRWFLPFAVVITGLSALIYGTVLQTIRLTANEILEQTAIDMQEISQQSDWQKLISYRTIDISKSLDTYIIVYDSHGNPVAGNARLEGSIPKMPDGLLEYAKTHDDHRLTWQPRPNARQAIVIQNLPDNGYVVVGRSLREIEFLGKRTFFLTMIGWAFTMIITFLSLFFVPNKKNKL